MVLLLPSARRRPICSTLRRTTRSPPSSISPSSRLEASLRAVQCPARPSSGHIAVASASAAAAWGQVVSVWPLGRPLHYVTPKAQAEFWPQGRAGAADVNVDARLTDALRRGSEVLFAAEDGRASFVAVAAGYERELLQFVLGDTRGAGWFRR